METNPTRTCELLVGLPYVNVLGVDEVPSVNSVASKYGDRIGPRRLCMINKTHDHIHQLGYRRETGILIERWPRIESQIRELRQMVKVSRSCIDIPCRTSSGMKELSSAVLQLFDDHAGHYATGQMVATRNLPRQALMRRV